MTLRRCGSRKRETWQALAVLVEYGTEEDWTLVRQVLAEARGSLLLCAAFVPEDDAGILVTYCEITRQERMFWEPIDGTCRVVE